MGLKMPKTKDSTIVVILLVILISTKPFEKDGFQCVELTDENDVGKSCYSRVDKLIRFLLNSLTFTAISNFIN